MSNHSIEKVLTIKEEPVIRHVLTKLEGLSVFILHYSYGGVEYLPTLRDALKLGLRVFNAEAQRYKRSCNGRDFALGVVLHLQEALEKLNEASSKEEAGQKVSSGN